MQPGVVTNTVTMMWEEEDGRRVRPKERWIENGGMIAKAVCS